MVQFAVLAQACRHSFTLFAGIDKNKALLSPRMFKNVTKTGIRLTRSRIGLFIENGQGFDIGPPFPGLGILDIRGIRSSRTGLGCELPASAEKDPEARHRVHLSNQ